MKKILIIGGSGLLGSELSHIIDDAYVTFNSNEINRPESYKLNIADVDALNKILEKLEPDTVIVTAALTDVDKCEKDPQLAFKINAEPFYIITNYLKRVNGRLIQISTDYVFSGELGNYKEDNLRNPINVYGLTKMQAEDIIMNSGIDYTIIRTSGIFGTKPASGKTNFFLWIYKNLTNNKEISVVKDQFYSPTLNTILANGIKEIVEKEISGIIHFSSTDRISRFEFAKLVAEEFNLNIDLIRETSMDKIKWIAKRPRDSSLNNEKAKKVLNNKPITVEDEIKYIKNLKYINKL